VLNQKLHLKECALHLRPQHQCQRSLRTCLAHPPLDNTEIPRSKGKVYLDHHAETLSIAKQVLACHNHHRLDRDLPTQKGSDEGNHYLLWIPIPQETVNGLPEEVTEALGGDTKS